MNPTLAEVQCIVTDDMVRRALAAFDCGTGDPNDYKRRMRFALEAALGENQKDAARYRWLRDNGHIKFLCYGKEIDDLVDVVMAKPSVALEI